MIVIKFFGILIEGLSLHVKDGLDAFFLISSYPHQNTFISVLRFIPAVL